MIKKKTVTSVGGEKRTACLKMAGVKEVIKKISQPLRLSRKTTIAIVAVIFLLGLIYFKRHWFVVATVGGQPIWRWQFNQALEKQHGSQVLGQLIDEKLIKQEAKREGVKISQERIDQEVKQIEENLGAENSLEEALALRGFTMERLRKDIETQLVLEELLSVDLEISQEEIDQYLVDNEALITAEGEEERANQAFQAIRESKMNEKFQGWYQNLREKSRIVSFLPYFEN